MESHFRRPKADRQAVTMPYWQVNVLRLLLYDEGTQQGILSVPYSQLVAAASTMKMEPAPIQFGRRTEAIGTLTPCFGDERYGYDFGMDSSVHAKTSRKRECQHGNSPFRTMRHVPQHDGYEG